jgi:hypothetical protein
MDYYGDIMNLRFIYSNSLNRLEIVLLGAFLFMTGMISAQNKGEWKNKQCAVSLTYDDALNVDLDNVIPLLNSLRLIGSYMINGQTGEQLIALVKQAMEKKALLVLLFHGVGGEHDLNVSLEAHSKLLHFLKENEKDIWVAPLIDIAGYIKQYRR